MDRCVDAGHPGGRLRRRGDGRVQSRRGAWTQVPVGRRHERPPQLHRAERQPVPVRGDRALMGSGRRVELERHLDGRLVADGQGGHHHRPADHAESAAPPVRDQQQGRGALVEDRSQRLQFAGRVSDFDVHPAVQDALQHHGAHVRRVADFGPARHHRAKVPRPAAASRLRSVRVERVRRGAGRVHADLRSLPVPRHSPGPGHADGAGLRARRERLRVSASELGVDVGDASEHAALAVGLKTYHRDGRKFLCLTRRSPPEWKFESEENSEK